MSALGLKLAVPEMFKFLSKMAHDTATEMLTSFSPVDINTNASTMEPQAINYLFKLPPELRNYIYDFLYTAETNYDGTIDLDAIRPPTKDLALTCRRFYNESYGLFKVAYRDYWHHEFAIDVDGFSLNVDTRVSSLHNVSEVDLAHVSRLRLTFLCTADLAQPGATCVINLSKSEAMSTWTPAKPLFVLLNHPKAWYERVTGVYTIICGGPLARVLDQTEFKGDLSHRVVELLVMVVMTAQKLRIST